MQSAMLSRALRMLAAADRARRSVPDDFARSRVCEHGLHVEDVGEDGGAAGQHEISLWTVTRWLPARLRIVSDHAVGPKTQSSGNRLSPTRIWRVNPSL